MEAMRGWFDDRFEMVRGVFGGRHYKVWIGISVGLPFACLAVLLAMFAVNVPYLDQWELVDVFKKYHDGQLGFADFFAQHNEHRLFFPRLVMVGLAVLSGWDIRLEVLASLFFAALAFVFLFSMLAQTITRRRLLWLAGMTISLIFFSPLQWENWLWGWQLQWYLNVLGLVVAVWALTAWKAPAVWRMSVAAIAALVATYSLASGFFVWVICLPLLWRTQPLRRWLGLWCAVAVAVGGLHYIGYHDPLGHPAKTLLLHEPLAFLEYMLVYIGHPVTLHWWHAVFVAPVYLAALAATVVYLYRHVKDQLLTGLLPWLCLGLYACLAAVSTAVTRLGFGAEQAYASRYTTLAQLLLIVYIVLLYKIVEMNTGRGTGKESLVRKRAIAALAIVTILVVCNFAKGAVQLRQHGLYLRDVRACAQTARSIDDSCLVKLYPLPDVAWQRLLYLRSIHWAGQ